ncbi:MAG: hypothetical protein FD180_710 [Planctomycetota bacterium]|nr:MAG: hypothetical protein FD180_710 [Planctomycetota bacterium]
MGEWVNKKFRNPVVEGVRQRLCAARWNAGLVHGNVKEPEEFRLIEKQGIKLVSFSSILGELRAAGTSKRQGAAGNSLAELLAFLPKQDGV